MTGAASGIGRAIAELLHARGAKVIAEDIDSAVESLAKPGLVPFVADVTKDGSAEKAVSLAIEKFGRLDLLVNNAGRILKDHRGSFKTPSQRRVSRLYEQRRRKPNHPLVEALANR